MPQMSDFSHLAAEMGSTMRWDDIGGHFFHEACT